MFETAQIWLLALFFWLAALVKSYGPLLLLFGTLLVPDVGEERLLKAALGHTAMTATVKLKLYTSNTTPAEGDNLATYTEANGNNYAEKSITNANWSIATAAGTTEGAYAEQTWTFTGALGNVYGYFFADATAGTLLWAERFSDGPYNIVNNGDQIKVTPKIQLA